MNRNQALQDMKRRYAEYLKPAKKRGTYICPLCGNGTGADGDGIAINRHDHDQTHLKCFKCGFYGDIIDLIKQDQHLNTDAEAFEAARDFFRIDIDGDSQPTRQEAHKAPDMPVMQDTQEEARPDFTAYFAQMAANIDSAPALEYLNSRHISIETARRFMLGYDLRFTQGTGPQAWRALIIPTSKESYAARNTDPNADKGNRYRKQGKAHLFNAKALQRDPGRALFITEGEIDALSIIEAGAEAVALGSTANVDKFAPALKACDRPLIVCLDNDKAGADALDALKRAGVHFTAANVCGDHKDPNDALCADFATFKAAVQASESKAAGNLDGISAYITQLMQGEIQTFTAASRIRTGFDVLDRRSGGGLYPGLYAVGAISSLGKTTFIHQMADQIAAAGGHVLFFSLEQSRLELATKSLARTMAQADYNNALTSLKIRQGVTSRPLAAAIQTYTQAVGDRMNVIEGDFTCTVATISEYVNRYIERHKARPVVIVDYLQIMQAQQQGAQRRDDIDANVTELKRLTRAKNVPVIVISSVNRQNYLMPVDFESFKESGGIEYTADVVWGLQLACMDDPLFNQDKKTLEKRARIKEAKSTDPRDIQLVCLKNRFGGVDWSVAYKYYPRYDLFEEVTPDGFTPAPDADLPDTFR